MSSPVTIEANRRTDLGKGASRRLRRDGRLPGVVYGGQSEPCSITLSHNQIWNSAAKEWFYSHILDLQIDGAVEKVVVKDMQRHPYKALITHVDFLRVVADQKLRTHVPLHFLNAETCPGAKAGGLVVHDLIEVEVLCLPKDLPEAIEVDLAKLEIGHSIHLSDVAVPAGIELPDLHRGQNHSVVSVVKVRGNAETTEEAAAPADEK